MASLGAHRTGISVPHLRKLEALVIEAPDPAFAVFPDRDGTQLQASPCPRRCWLLVCQRPQKRDLYRAPTPAEEQQGKSELAWWV